MKNHTDGEFGGLGIEIIIDEGFIRIISPIDDTPAYKASIKGGDLIIYIDDECINGISAEEALEKLRGKPKTKVKLKIKRGDQVPFDLEIERDIIKVQSVKAEILDDIGYVRISTFDKNTTKDLKKFICENIDKNLHGIVIDLRNNPGGLLEEAVSVSDIFLDGGAIVATRGRTKENTKSFFADSGDLTNGLPLVILINSGTASAPEIVAGALRDNKRAIIVGVRSFGKGSVQKVIPLSEKTAMKLTVAKHYTPSGECIQANGITPDIEADYAMIKKPDNLFIIREEFFNNALDVDKKAKNKKFTDAQNKKTLDELGKKKDKKEMEDEDQELIYRKLSLKERVERDYQLAKAFDVVRVLEKFKNISVKDVKK
jgi:carboxyl-terminal processing protease